MSQNNTAVAPSTNPTNTITYQGEQLVRHGAFRVILDARARPHYIMLADSNIRAVQVPHPGVPYYQEWLEALRMTLTLLGPETAISIHMGFYRTQRHFHLHFVACDPVEFKKHWISARGQSKVAALDSWEATNAAKTRQYKVKDIESLRRRNRSRRATDTVRAALLQFNARLSPDMPLLSLPTTDDLGQLYSDLRSLAYTLGVNRKERGAHICVRPIGEGSFSGWLLLDLRTYHSLFDTPERADTWLLAFEANTEFEIWT